MSVPLHCDVVCSFRVLPHGWHKTVDIDFRIGIQISVGINEVPGRKSDRAGRSRGLKAKQVVVPVAKICKR